MDKNVFKFSDFQNKKRGINMLNETVIIFDDHYKVRTNIDVPFSLVNSYVKKIKEDTGEDIKKMYSDMEIAEEIAKYVSSSYLNIENIPTDILTPEKQDLVVGQGQSQAQQSQGQAQQGQQGQDLDLDLDLDFNQGQAQQGQSQQGQAQQGQSQQGQAQQGQSQQGQVQQGQGQQGQAQKTAQKISPQEI